MPSRPSRSSAALRRRAETPGAGRAAPDAQEQREAKPRRRARPLAHELAAEVERLERALAAAQAKVAELEVCADIDPLTGARNRRGFARELERSLAYVKRYGVQAALVYIDLDRLKPVNDQHGHAAGDAVIKAVAETLTRHTRASDLFARLGGDEFAVLLWNASEEDARAKALRLEEAVKEVCVRFGAHDLSVGASAGVAMLGPLDAPAFVLELADRAMYARKAEKAAAAEAAVRERRVRR
jgi:diguanylate cyclase (GGDEF)-like protein